MIRHKKSHFLIPIRCTSRAIGAAHGLEYGEAFYHVDESNSGYLGSVDGDEVERYVSERAVPKDEL